MAATVILRLPGPVPPAAETVAQEGVPDTVQEQLAAVVTVTEIGPPAAATLALVAERDTEHGAASVTVNT